MRKVLHIFLVALLVALGNTVSAQYGTQFENRGYENWNGLNSNKANDTEPYHWHATPTATGSLNSMIPKSGVIASDSHVRPGSSGSKSAKVTGKSVLGVVANGNITNGRMNAGSLSADGTSNYNYTDRTGHNGVHCTLLNGFVPDSITVWICLYTQNASDEGKIYSAIHGDYDFKYIANATISSNSHLVKAASKKFSRTTSSTSTYTWQRISVAYGSVFESNSNPATGSCTDPKYVFVVITTNKTAGAGTAGDYLLVDDILLIYNPTLTTGTIASTTYNAGQSITVPFTLTGTMSPENLNKAANEVIAELSDANGSFGNPIELGRVTTNTSGSITATIPESIPSGNGYRVRVRSTNYPMTANDNNVNIRINGFSNFFASVSPENSGTINLTNGTNYGQASEGRFLDGTTVNIEATANEGYSFVNWTNNGSAVSTDANYSFTLNGNTNLVANFNQSLTITVNANPANGGNVVGGGNYSAGATAHLVATANPGFAFTNWTKNGTIVSTEASYDVTVTESATYTANFIERYTITVNANPTGYGTVEGEGTYDANETVTLIATPNEGNVFVNWAKDDNVVSTEAEYSFPATENATYTANFTELRYYITVNANPAEGGTVEGEGSYEPDAEVTLVATANEGYVFLNWTKGSTVVTTETEYTFNATEDATYNANFVEESATVFFITASAGEHGTITPQGEIEVNSGESQTFIITPDTEYEIMSVIVDGEDVGPVSEYTFENVAWNHSIEAVFQSDGIRNAQGENAISIYPSPATNTLYVISNGIREIKVYDLNGNIVKNEIVNGTDRVELNISDLAAGVYTLKCVGANTTTRNFIKK